MPTLTMNDSLFDPILVELEGVTYQVPPLTKSMLDQFDDLTTEFKEKQDLGLLIRRAVLVGIPEAAAARADMRWLLRLEYFIRDCIAKSATQIVGTEIEKNALRPGPNESLK